MRTNAAESARGSTRIRDRERRKREKPLGAVDICSRAAGRLRRPVRGGVTASPPARPAQDDSVASLSAAHCRSRERRCSDSDYCTCVPVRPHAFGQSISERLTAITISPPGFGFVAGRNWLVGWCLSQHCRPGGTVQIRDQAVTVQLRPPRKPPPGLPLPVPPGGDLHSPPPLI